MSSDIWPRYDTSRDHEFTDWDALAGFADQWAMAVEGSIADTRPKPVDVT